MNQSHNWTTYNTWFLDFTTWISGEYWTCVELKQDYKIATKTIALRLEKVLENDSVHPTQTVYHLKKTLRCCLNADAEALLHKVKFEDKKIWLIIKQTECMFISIGSLLGSHNDDGYEENVT